MTFDELVARLEPAEADRKLVSRRAAEVIGVLGIGVDEATGALFARERRAPYMQLEQRNVRYAGMPSRRRR